MKVKSTKNVKPVKQQDSNTLFEAEVEYVLDELQKRAHLFFGGENGSISDCAVEIGSRLADITPGGRPGHYWLRDLGMIVIQIMKIMEANDYKLSEEILEILSKAREDHSEMNCFAPEKGHIEN